ncbi:MAG: HEAT repeat domain-containing protein [Oscillospiraceae bacterium]|nr:HEAT repeat domain-containing protein [Oscillospiraceae bacterium]
MEEESIIEKLDMLKKIEENVEYSDKFSDEEYNILESYSRDKDYIIRAKVAKILVNSTCPKDESILFKLSRDKKYLVRAEACDSLSVSTSFKAFDMLKRTLKKEKSGMVRAYAIHSLGSISKKLDVECEIKPIIKQLLKKEKSNLVKISSYKVLYSFGDKECLYYLINKLESKKYQNRCAVVNCLDEIVCQKDRAIDKIIEEALIKHLEIEKNELVISTIDKILKKL